MAGAHAQGNLHGVMDGGEVPSGSEDDAVFADDEGAIEDGEVFDGLADFRV